MNLSQERQTETIVDFVKQNQGLKRLANLAIVIQHKQLDLIQKDIWKQTEGRDQDEYSLDFMKNLKDLRNFLNRQTATSQPLKNSHHIWTHGVSVGLASVVNNSDSSPCTWVELSREAIHTNYYLDPTDGLIDSSGFRFAIVYGSPEREVTKLNQITQAHGIELWWQENGIYGSRLIIRENERLLMNPVLLTFRDKALQEQTYNEYEKIFEKRELRHITRI